MHAFGKITLFFCAGAIYVATHKTEISDMRGIGRTMPFTTFAFLLGSLSVIGLPPMGGTWSKWYLALGAADADQVVFIAVLMVSSLLNIAYLLPIPIRGFFLAPPEGSTSPGMREAPLFCVIPLCLTAIGCIVLFFFAGEIAQLLEPLVASRPVTGASP
jgi:multicomponent Na+:H+ antiporter subunit D